MAQETSGAVCTQNLILSAAERLFTRFGFAKVTMEEIAGEAGLKKPSLYYYYATKEDLFRAVVEKKRSEFRDRAADVLQTSETAATRLKQYVLIRFEYFRNLQELNILDFKHATHNAPALVEMFRRHAAEELKWISGLLSAGNEHDEFQVESPEEVAEMFQHVLRGLRLRIIRHSESLRPTATAFAQLQNEMKLFTQIFLSGIGKRNCSEEKEK
jgi:TetR/AcrR family transcriptional repressor of mexJK operon